jgi:hypothetical protein
LFQSRLELAEESLDVGVRGIMVQDFVRDPSEGTVVDDRENTERAIVQLVGRDIAGKVS